MTTHKLASGTLALTFYGAAGTVTGSKTLLETAEHTIMVDCGLFQGLKELRLLNWDKPQFEAKAIEAILLTHAHLDHCGYLPLLVKHGFTGKIYLTPPTAQLAKIILLDSARLQMEDAADANARGYSKHKPALPLYDERDVERTLDRFVVAEDDGQWHSLSQALKFRYRKNGHILGSAVIEVDVTGTRVVFSGDLGRSKPILLESPTVIEEADYLILESTYGDRLHSLEPPEDHLASVINETISKGGTLIIPSFAVGRAQDLMFLINKLKAAKRIPHVPVALDSPMAIKVTDVYEQYPKWHRLSLDCCKDIYKNVELLSDIKDSRANRLDKNPKIVIAGSGMLTGGRVLYYLEDYLADPRATILLAGFQAPGTRGRSLADGTTELKFHGHYIPVKARIAMIGALSAHADQAELLAWVGSMQQKPRTILLNHGEPQAADTLRRKLLDTQNISTHVVKREERIVLNLNQK